MCPSRDEQRESSERGGSRCDGAAARNYFATFHTNYFGQHYLETFHKIVLDTIILPHFTKLFLTQLFCHILQNYFGQHYFATFHQIILETIILPHFTKLFCHISRHYFGQNYFATFHKKVYEQLKIIFMSQYKLF